MRNLRGWFVAGLFAILALIAACAPTGEESAVLMRVDEDPTVTMKVWFQVGSNDDPDGKSGLAYLTAQMISEASTTEHELEEILELLYPLASSYGVRVNREMTVLTGRTHRDNLETYVPLFTDAYLRPAFDQDDFERVKNDTLNYLRNALRFQADEELGKAALNGIVFAGTGYAHPVEGTVAGVESITLDDVQAFYGSHYVADKMVVALAGGYDDELVRRLEATRSERPSTGAARAVAPMPTKPEGIDVLLVDKPDADASISFGYPIDLLRGEREFYALWLANSWLGEHRSSSSHLYKVIRETRGMNYGDYSYIEEFPEGGRRSVPPTHVGRRAQMFQIWIRTLPNAQAHFALRAALRELETLINDGMSEETLELTRSFLLKYSAHYAETTSARLGYAVDDRFYGIEAPGHLARMRQILAELTLDEVNAAIKKHLQTKNLKIAIVTGAAKDLKSALSEDRPSPMSYESPKSADVLKEDETIAVFPIEIDANRVTIVPVAEMFER